MWLVPTANEDDFDNVSAIQVYKAPKSKQETMNEIFNKTQKDASLHEKLKKYSEIPERIWQPQVVVHGNERTPKSMWDGRPGQITVDKHCIVLNHTMHHPYIPRHIAQASRKVSRIEKKQRDCEK